MMDASRKRDAVDDAGQAPDTSKHIAEEPAPQEHPDRDEPGWDVWFLTSLLCLPAAILGGVFVAVENGLVLGLVAGFLGLVVGQAVALALALLINADTTTDPEWQSLGDLPADQRVGSGLRTRRKENLSEVAREVAIAMIFFLSAPVATLLTGLLIGWAAGD